MNATTYPTSATPEAFEAYKATVAAEHAKRQAKRVAAANLTGAAQAAKTSPRLQARSEAVAPTPATLEALAQADGADPDADLIDLIDRRADAAHAAADDIHDEPHAANAAEQVPDAIAQLRSLAPKPAAEPQGADLEAIKREIAGIDAAIQALKDKRAGLAKQLPGTSERKPRGDSRMARLLRYLEGQTEPRSTDQIAADMGITTIEAATGIHCLRRAGHEIENTRGLGFRLISK